jgi:cytidine deaminase
MPDASRLLTAAHDLLTHAYAPYSNVRVAVVVESANGYLIGGINVENSSYGLTCCAERVALFCALSQGQREFKALAVVTDSLASIEPCGACRQVMSEHCPPDMPVYMQGADGIVNNSTVGVLLPNAFSLKK